MKKGMLFIVGCLFIAQAQATTLYVDLNNSSPVPPYTNWNTAATTIQDALNVALSNDTVMVTNGVYAVGGALATNAGATTNRVAIPSGVTLRSVNGWDVTIIQGSGSMGDDAARCAYVGSEAVLSGFTLTNGTTRTSGGYDSDQAGGGVWSEESGTITNCVLVENSAETFGGGAFGGELLACTLSGNTSYDGGGGAFEADLKNCSLVKNRAEYNGGGAIYSTLEDCELIENVAGNNGGGAMDSWLDGCLLKNNYARFNGGGAAVSYDGGLENCALISNSAEDSGGGFYIEGAPEYAAASEGKVTKGEALVQGELNNCTLTGNSAGKSGGGVSGGEFGEVAILNNCIVYYNQAPESPNYTDSEFDYSCTTPLPEEGKGNMSISPQLASPSHLSTNSPCIAAGSTNYTNGTDFDGEDWLIPPSMGCDEMVLGAALGTLWVEVDASRTNVTTGYSIQFSCDVTGQTTESMWIWGDGTTTSNQPFASHAFLSNGTYLVELIVFNDSNPLGVSDTITVQVSDPIIHYVDASNTSPSSPYTSWATAATNIQDAIDASTQFGAHVLVTNGVYETGGRAVVGLMTNRVVLKEGLIVQSVNGPEVTIIKGEELALGAVRCAYVGAEAFLSGFTLTNGHTLATGDYDTEQSGGGVWCGSSAVVSNCVITGNEAGDGGGADHGTLTHCRIVENTVEGSGGGVVNSFVINSVLSGNFAEYDGGAAAYSTLNNCTVSGNTALGDGGGIYGGTANNSIVWYNQADGYGNDLEETFRDHACSPDVPYSINGGLTNAPLFVDQANGDFHIVSGSPCIDHGDNTLVSESTDLDGNPRIVNGTVDIGAYEGGVFVSRYLMLSTSSISEKIPLQTSPSNRTFEVWNLGTAILNYSISDDASWFSCSPTNGSSSGEHDSISVVFDTAGLGVGSYTGTITVASAGTTNAPKSITVIASVFDPFSESFETGFGEWRFPSGFNYSWQRNANQTPSSKTGPNGASDGRYYVFTEASGRYNKTYAMENTFDLSSMSAPKLTFDYHMYGSDMGTLSVDVFDGTWHSNLWSRSGQQQTSSSAPWLEAQVDLSAFGGKTGVVIRIIGLTGSSYHSDMAVDKIHIASTSAPADTDSDGIPDWWEQRYFGGITNCDANGHADGDTQNNKEEYIAGTDPTNTASFFGLTNAASVASGFLVQWNPSVSNREYAVSWTNDLSGSFTTLVSGIEFPQNSYTDTVHGAEGAGFYKVEVQLK